MFSLLDLHFGLWSLYLHVLRTQRILGFFIVITHKSSRSEDRITWFLLHVSYVLCCREPEITGCKIHMLVMYRWP